MTLRCIIGLVSFNRERERERESASERERERESEKAGMCFADTDDKLKSTEENGTENSKYYLNLILIFYTVVYIL